MHLRWRLWIWLLRCSGMTSLLPSETGSLRLHGVHVVPASSMVNSPFRKKAKLTMSQLLAREDCCAPTTSINMSFGELLDVEPRILKFPFELRKLISFSIQLHNKTREHIAFKFLQAQKMRPKKYNIDPPKGVVLPRSTCNVIITMHRHQEGTPDKRCEEELFIQSVIMHQAVTAVAKNISLEMLRCTAFMESGNNVDLVTLRVIYVPPSQPSSPVYGSSNVCDNFFGINPRILKLPFELRKPVTFSVQLYNITNEYIAFKIKQDQKKRPKKYTIQPPKGVVLPRSTCEVVVTIQGHQEASPGIRCVDVLFIENVIMHQAVNTVSKDINLEMLRCTTFMESGYNVDVVIFQIVYMPPTRPPSQINEGSEGGSWTMASSPYNENLARSGISTVSSFTAKPREKMLGVHNTLRHETFLNMLVGNSKENPVKVESDDNDDDIDCYEIDPISFNRNLTFNEMDDVSLVAEKGPVALIDFPHPRHLCGCFPFRTTPHEMFCSKCFCCVCEVAAPCPGWKGINGHCHLSKKILAHH